MVSMLPDVLPTVQLLREYCVGCSEERMDEKVHAVSEAKKTLIALVEKKSPDNQDKSYDSSSSCFSCFEGYPVLYHDGLCKVPYLAETYPGPTFVKKKIDAS
eukprot:9292959-Ditylum_brightwellii.AAC.1